MKILKSLSHTTADLKRGNHVTPLIDSFTHKGPNGIHQCLVFDVMGPSTSTMIEHLPLDLRGPGPDSTKETRGRFPLWMAKSVLRQTLLGLEFLHQNGVIHGDVQPGNILFSLRSLDALHERELAQTDGADFVFTRSDRSNGDVDFSVVETKAQEDSDIIHKDNVPEDVNADVAENVMPENGLIPGSENDPSLPRYILQKEPMFKYVDLEPPLLIRLSDLGGSFFANEAPEKIVTPRGLRSPEMILKQPIGQPHDMWSFGCLLFEFLTGRVLFFLLQSYPDSDNEEDVTNADNDTDDDHVLQMAQFLGPLSKSFLSLYPRRNLYFNEAGGVIKDYVGETPDVTSEHDKSRSQKRLNIEGCVFQERGGDLSDSEASIVAGLLRVILQFDPEKRPTAALLLKHPWFNE